MIKQCIWCDEMVDGFYCERCKKIFDDLAMELRKISK
jgi:hypothetical protein